MQGFLPAEPQWEAIPQKSCSEWKMVLPILIWSGPSVSLLSSADRKALLRLYVVINQALQVARRHSNQAYIWRFAWGSYSLLLWNA
jgi:hypothetical protein